MIVVRSSWFVTHGSWLVKALSTSHEQLATSHKKRAVYKDSSFFTHNMVVRNVINSKPIYFTDDYFYILCSA